FTGVAVGRVARQGFMGAPKVDLPSRGFTGVAAGRIARKGFMSFAAGRFGRLGIYGCRRG
ncbi:MAG: hypothetical protein ABI151_12790, partial [Chitinophagaceae bacterium]